MLLEAVVLFLDIWLSPFGDPMELQNLNNLNQAQLVDLIATEISNANNIDKTTLILAIDDLSGKTKAKGGNVIDSLKNIAGFVMNDPSGNVAKNIIKTANNVGLNQ